jgi:hypothetical protein
LQYSIYESQQEPQRIWNSHDEAVARKGLAMFLPTGVTVEEFLKKWQNLNYGAPNNGQLEVQEDQTPDPKALSAAHRKFIPAHSAILRLRKLAQKGRLASQLEEGLPKVAWGQTIEQSFETAGGFGRIIFQDSVIDSSPVENNKNGTDAQSQTQTPS